MKINIEKKWLYLLGLSLIWGSSFILIKKSLIGLSPLQVGSLRIVFSSIIIFLIGFNKIKTIQKDKWKWIAVSAIIGTFFPAFLFAYAETQIDSAVASILNSLVPMNTVLIGLAVFKISTTKRQSIGVIIGFIGTAVLIISGSDLNPDQNYMYSGLVIICSILYATNVNLIKKYLYDVNAVAIAAGQFSVIFIPSLIVLLYSDFFKIDLINNKIIHESLLYVLLLSFFGTAMAKILFNKLIQISSPVFASSVTYSMLIVSVIWGVLDGELFNSSQAIATVLIIIGVYLSNKKKPIN
ncbi:MAG: drug/metabolite transporter (DMT)-like permease [Flavobacteriaceae bacterium]|jgi:drug/metabolite transporter (DMT)-like permease|tara:strand:- start:1050 stop:1937 length:888 start_codon:yes stop_codon:yes gene_type:complete